MVARDWKGDGDELRPLCEDQVCYFVPLWLIPAVIGQILNLHENVTRSEVWFFLKLSSISK